MSSSLSRQQLPKFFRQLRSPERLFQYLAAEPLSQPARLGVTGYEQPWRPGNELLSTRCKRGSIQIWHRQIDDQQIELSVPFEEGKGILSARSLDGIMSKCAQHDRCDRADSAIVVDHQYARGWPGVPFVLLAGLVVDPQSTRRAREINAENGSSADLAVVPPDCLTNP